MPWPDDDIDDERTAAAAELGPDVERCIGQACRCCRCVEERCRAAMDETDGGPNRPSHERSGHA